jgi:hypothetical protein
VRLGPHGWKQQLLYLLIGSRRQHRQRHQGKGLQMTLANLAIAAAAAAAGRLAMSQHQLMHLPTVEGPWQLQVHSHREATTTTRTTRQRGGSWLLCCSQAQHLLLTPGPRVGHRLIGHQECHQVTQGSTQLQG